MIEVFRAEQKKICKTNISNVPIKKFDGNYVIPDYDKIELFKQHLSDIFQPHSDIFIPHTIRVSQIPSTSQTLYSKQSNIHYVTNQPTTPFMLVADYTDDKAII